MEPEDMKSSSSLRAQRSNPSLDIARTAAGWIAASAFGLLAMTFVATPLHAETKKIEITIDDGDVEINELKDEEKAEKAPEEPAKDPKDKTFRFAPDFCDFEITFPEKPMIAQKCIPDGECFDLNSYTMVYDLQTTVDVSVTCNPSTPENYKRYNDQVMKAALAGMIDNRNLTSHDMQFKEFDTTKSASLTGTGITGSQEKIYNAQLWIGPNSVFTIQAELVGGAHDTADKSFSDILKSIKQKEGKQLPKTKKEKSPIPAKEKNQ